jgi:hypothetical protein
MCNERIVSLFAQVRSNHHVPSADRKREGAEQTNERTTKRREGDGAEREGKESQDSAALLHIRKGRVTGD